MTLVAPMAYLIVHERPLRLLDLRCCCLERPSPSSREGGAPDAQRPDARPDRRIIPAAAGFLPRYREPTGSAYRNDLRCY